MRGSHSRGVVGWRDVEPAGGGTFGVELCLFRRRSRQVGDVERMQRQGERCVMVVVVAAGKDEVSYLEGLSVEGVLAEADAFIAGGLPCPHCLSERTNESLRRRSA